MEQAKSRHHLLYPAAEHMLRGDGRFLRTTSSLIPRIHQEDHDDIHRQLSVVPGLGHNTLRIVAKMWTPENDTVRDLGQLCRHLGSSALHSKVDRIEGSLANLTAEALEQEKDFLAERGYGINSWSDRS